MKSKGLKSMNNKDAKNMSADQNENKGQQCCATAICVALEISFVKPWFTLAAHAKDLHTLNANARKVRYVCVLEVFSEGQGGFFVIDQCIYFGFGLTQMRSFNELLSEGQPLQRWENFL